MADRSKIEWTDATWNPVRGCSVVSEGCRNCYAMAVAARFSKEGQAYDGLAYRNASGAHWTGNIRLVEKHLLDPLRWERPRRIFVNSMSDLFHESIPATWIDQIFGVMALASWHQFQVLTKRAERMQDYLSSANARLNIWSAAFAVAAGCPHQLELARRHQHARHNREQWPLRNIWLGVSVEDQKTADERIPILIETPAALRWVSAEPLLGPIDLQVPWSALNDEYPEIGIHWAVVGGESGPSARPLHPDWVRSLRDQCVAASVPFFFKQSGEWDGGGVFGSECDDPCGRCVMALRTWNGTRWSGAASTVTSTDWEAGSQTGALQIHRVGKKAAGRLLDGREWNEYPREGAH